MRQLDVLFSVGLDDLDPAADFLAREQEQLGELEEEIGSLSGRWKKKDKYFTHTQKWKLAS